MRTKIILLCMAITLCSACSTVGRIATSEGQGSTFSPTSADNVEVYSTSKAKKEYTIIGQVLASADAGENANIPVDLLKEQAAKLGADAIVDLRLSISYGYWTSGITSVGTAVKYK